MAVLSSMEPPDWSGDSLDIFWSGRGPYGQKVVEWTSTQQVEVAEQEG